ncbi:MAG: hypothetical protein ACRYFX_13730 [Janthinobacterium lividum]
MRHLPLAGFTDCRCRALLGLAGLLLLGGGTPARGQADSLATVGRRFASYSQRHPIEKLFGHLDRPAYVSGETIWLKLYTVEGTTQQPLAASTVAYVEVLDPQQQPVLQVKLALRQATSQGSLVLPATLPTGRYTVRAYTNWMQNFGAEFYFHAPITIVNTRVPLGAAATPLATTYDAQFFPEGGYLVQGLGSKVGFKLTDAAGRGVAAEGTVLDATGATVARFSPLRFGLGSFSFTPTKAGAAYRAVLKFANGRQLTQALPVVREQGYVLRLEDAGPEQLRVVVQTQGPALASERLFLLGHARQQVAVAAEGQLVAGQAVFVVPRRQLAAGVAHFTLFNSRRQPVCERLWFSPPPATLALHAQADKPQYASREPVTLRLTTGAQPANLSVAVYQLDSLSAAGGADITSYLWLSADVRGPIERPDHYCATPDPAAADNLMLTQGWSRFSWARVLTPRPDSLPTFAPELHGHLVRGRVLDRRTGAPVQGLHAYLAAPSRRIRLYGAISQASGSLLFEVPDWYGPQQLVVQTDTRRDSLYRLEILSPFSGKYAAAPARPLPLSERWAASLLRRHVQAGVQQLYSAPPGPYLAPAADSGAFYGHPTARYLLDTYTRFPTLEDVFREYVPGILVRNRKDGFHLLVPDNNTREVMESPLVLLDGVPVFDTNRLMAFDPLKIQRLDVVLSHYLSGLLTYNGIIGLSTYRGDLAGFPLNPHALLQEYEGVQGQREFYAPRYDSPATLRSRQPDFRNLLYWNPEVHTTSSGSTLTFYTSDQAGSYRVVVQGLTPSGLTGNTSFIFSVKTAL